jgi:GNAT superfamily N-acetyltransferase
VHRGITVRRTDAIHLGRHATQLEALYRRCFAEPPWHETVERLAGFRGRLTAHLGRDGFVCLVAVERLGTDRAGTEQAGTDGAGAERVGVERVHLVGAVYGWPAGHELAAGSTFDDALAAAVPPAVAGRLVSPALIVAELMVDPARQRRGIGRALLSRFTEGWPAAWLCTHPDAPAAGMYRRDGWREEVAFVVEGCPMVLFTWQAR